MGGNSKEAKVTPPAAAPSQTQSTRGKQPQRRLHILQQALPILLHLLSLYVYLRPLTSSTISTPSTSNLISSPSPVLDESHIVSSANPDAAGTSSLAQVFKNDYWGRPITNNPSSHKSWRPLTVLSFRWLKGGVLSRWFQWDELFVHRLVNVVLHAAVAELASLLALQLYPDFVATPPLYQLVLRCTVKLLFALHPAHVECVANAANRPHIIAVLTSALMCCPETNVLFLMLAGIVGLLSSETAVFQLPAVLVTMTVIRWKRWRRRLLDQPNHPDRSPGSQLKSLFGTMLSLIPRYLIVIALGVVYLGGRKYYDTLSIPDGLIRPAENPFYALTGTTRILTYALLLSIHLGKALLIDPIGFSHEYGFECIRNVTSVLDGRLVAPLGVYLVVGAGTFRCVGMAMNGVGASPAGAAAAKAPNGAYEAASSDPRRSGRGDLGPLLTWAVIASWLLVTLFPVSGFVKVGTSIADRIVFPSSFAFALFGGRFLAEFVLDFGNEFVLSGTAAAGAAENGRKELEEDEQRTDATSSALPKTGRFVAFTTAKAVLVTLGFGVLWARVDRRSTEWMDSMTLLESSLKSCPRSAKSNLEISKIYSGLYPDKYDLGRALSYLEKAEEIDPSYCDVHQQFAHCYIQQGRYLEFEERLTNAVMCPFSMGGSVPLWQRYWKQVTSDPRTGEQAKRRMEKYQAIINEAVMKATEEEEEEARRKQRKGAAASTNEL